MTAEEKSQVLIVEDEPTVSRMYSQLFTLEGFNVSEANTGKKAVEMIQTNHPDIVLLDIMMPGINGFDILNFMHNDPVLRKIPVLVLSNLTGDEIEKEALALGAVKFLIKSSVEPKKLVEITRDILTTYQNKNQ